MKISAILLLQFFLVPLVFLFPSKVLAEDEEQRPNIVLIMMDDMGFSDIGCFGGEIQTPHVDALAKNGLCFSQFYNAARCTPTRASLLTGLYAHQTGMGHMTWKNHKLPGYTGSINQSCVTLAEVLGTAGYRNYMAGKWHLVLYESLKKTTRNWPLQRGFDQFFGTLRGSGSFFTPKSLRKGNEVAEIPADFYYTDAIADTTTSYIDQHFGNYPDQPFFCYVAFTAPHWPLHAKKADIARYVGKYRSGWDEIRKQRYKKLIGTGLINSGCKLTPRDKQSVAWDSLSKEEQEDLDLRMAIYAAQVDSADQGIGRIVDRLRIRGQLDNTIIIFLSDNGACAEVKDKKMGKLGTDASFNSYGLSWANASGTPFREYKHWVHEGGIATPLIVHWPDGIRSPGRINHQLGHVIDIMATCVELSGATYPEKYNGNFITPLDGKSLVPTFCNRPIQRDMLCWEHEGNRAIRKNDWKLVSKRNRDWELYRMDADRSELNDLAQKHPDRVTKMAAAWHRWAKRCQVLPQPKTKHWWRYSSTL